MRWETRKNTIAMWYSAWYIISRRSREIRFRVPVFGTEHSCSDFVWEFIPHQRVILSHITKMLKQCHFLNSISLSLFSIFSCQIDLSPLRLEGHSKSNHGSFFISTRSHRLLAPRARLPCLGPGTPRSHTQPLVSLPHLWHGQIFITSAALESDNSILHLSL